MRGAGEIEAQYVALGSSFAAGIGLGPRAPRSPYLCMRSTNGYPQQLARLTGLRLVDMTCSGATVAHVLRGGQYFQPPQLDGINERTQLVTLTAGGNDLRYVGDLTMLAGRNQRNIVGWLLRLAWKGPLPMTQRKLSKFRADFCETLTEIRRRAPRARVFVVTYPSILPPQGTCPVLGISEDEVTTMREVGARLAEMTRAVAHETGAEIIDMDVLSSDHHACSSTPWVNGWKKAEGVQFHPTLAGAEATAREIARVLGCLNARGTATAGASGSHERMESGR